jgi:membrane protein YdbS with pleckstrin-like domain
MVLPRKFLNEDEDLLAEMHPHWVFIFVPLITFIGVWLAIGALEFLVHKVPSWTSYPLLVIAAVPALWLLGRVLRWRTYTLALTSTRIVVRQGVIGRDTVQLRLQRITEINLTQKFWQRMVGTGSLVIDVQGDDDSLVLPDVRKPAIVQRVINSQINELVGGGVREHMPEELRPHDQPSAPPPPDDTPPFGVATVPSAPPIQPIQPEPVEEPAPPTTPGGATDGDIAQRLIELDDLRQRGIVSEEEFATKKAELLNRI